MARIVGVDIPREKRIEVALTYIYGIGPTLAKSVLEEAEKNWCSHLVTDRRKK